MTVEALLEKARQALSDARYLQADARADAAISRAYYAALHAARAALLSLGETPRTHHGVHTRFAFHFVATGRLERAVGDILTLSARERERSDYEALTVFDARAAADLIADVETFVRTVEAIILPPDTPATA